LFLVNLTYAAGIHTLVPAIKKFAGLKWGFAISSLDGVILLAAATEERLSPTWITYSRVVPGGHSIKGSGGMHNSVPGTIISGLKFGFTSRNSFRLKL